MSQLPTGANPSRPDQPSAMVGLPGLVTAFGFILAFSYPVLAISTGVRATYQLLIRAGEGSSLPALMSLTASLCYLLAALGFLYRRRWTWWFSVALLGFELVMVILIGTLSLVIPDLIGRTVWRHFGADYGYFPLFQPMLGLIWLFWPATRRAFRGSSGTVG